MIYSDTTILLENLISCFQDQKQHASQVIGFNQARNIAISTNTYVGIVLFLEILSISHAWRFTV